MARSKEEVWDSAFVDAEITKVRSEPSRDDDTMVFLVTITRRGGPWRFKLIRDEIRKAISSISGFIFEGISVAQDPDPYSFGDPDDPPKGAC